MSDHDLVRRRLREMRADLEPILQSHLLDEGRLIAFARERDIDVSGVITGDPWRFAKLGWLGPDELDESGGPRCHPFRIYTLHTILSDSRLPIGASASIDRDGLSNYLTRVATFLPSLEDIEARASKAELDVDLAVLLEPLYWPTITGQIVFSSFQGKEERSPLVARHHVRIKDLLQALNVDYWEKRHKRLREVASALDDNDDVYMLLRLSPWQKRQQVRGALGAALWIRHIAEVLRRGFEEMRGVRWVEEDRSHGQWFPGARERIYGSDRPLDQPIATKPHVAFEFGLHTGSVVRWYVEGETEYFATRRALPGAAVGGIELFNLRGTIANDRNNAALKLGDALEEDRALKRFSIISFDTDVGANTRVIRRYVQQDRIVGYIAAHHPDFEFANFTLAELTEIAAQLDEAEGASGACLRDGDWSGVSSAAAFEKRYKDLSARGPRSLKGERWGNALADCALTLPARPDTSELRPFVRAVDAAVRARSVNYDVQRDHYAIDPASFELTRRP